ncbi:MAG TPA: DUF5320 domain-containing protein [Sedimentisphaerales bacterium]|nr:DUF5320 domain-containing protein [Sedimentisphaerales bacterium]
MPGFDGTGPLGRGPMSGQGRGFCILRSSENSPGQLLGFAGLRGVPVSQTVDNFEKSGKEVTNMPFGDSTGPTGLGPMTGRAAGFCAGFPVPGYINPVVGKVGYSGLGIPTFGPYGAGLYGYGVPYPVPYAGWVNPWLRRGFGFGRGFGRGRCWGRGKFGYR